MKRVAPPRVTRRSRNAEDASRLRRSLYMLVRLQQLKTRASKNAGHRADVSDGDDGTLEHEAGSVCSMMSLNRRPLHLKKSKSCYVLASEPTPAAPKATTPSSCSLKAKQNGVKDELFHFNRSLREMGQNIREMHQQLLQEHEEQLVALGNLEDPDVDEPLMDQPFREPTLEGPTLTLKKPLPGRRHHRKAS